MQSLKNLSGYILHKFQGHITPMKLQKLLYYVKVWTTVAGKPILPKYQSFYAWKYGPVNPNIYHEYKDYGKDPIGHIPPFTDPTGEEKELIDFIIYSYGCYNAITLSKTTHTEDPWIKKQKYNGKITDKDILEYYTKESFAQNFPLKEDKEYYPPKTNSHYAYIFDMSEEDEAANISFKSLNDYLAKYHEATDIANKFVNQIG